MKTGVNHCKHCGAITNKYDSSSRPQHKITKCGKCNKDFMKTNPTPLTKEQIEHQFGKKKVVLTFYTGLKGQEIVLESRLVERIEQTDDVDELAIYVKMPSKDTKEFRKAVDQAILQERNRIVEKFEKAFKEKYQGAGEVFFPYESAGNCTIEEEWAYTNQEWLDIKTEALENKERKE